MRSSSFSSFLLIVPIFSFPIVQAICIYSVTTSILWSFSNLLGRVNTDGGLINTQTAINWWYTPTSAIARGGSNADVGALSLIETANFCYGSATMIFASVLFMRIITNTIISHPRNKVLINTNVSINTSYYTYYRIRHTLQQKRTLLLLTPLSHLWLLLVRLVNLVLHITKLPCLLLPSLPLSLGKIIQRCHKVL